MNKIKKLRNKADKLFQQVCLLLEPNCEACGKKAEVVHHFIPKSLSANLRYNIDNGISLCNSCHFKHHSTADPDIYEAMTKYKSTEWFELIGKERRKLIKPTIAYYEKQIKKLEKLYQTLH